MAQKLRGSLKLSLDTLLHYTYFEKLTSGLTECAVKYIHSVNSAIFKYVKMN